MNKTVMTSHSLLCKPFVWPDHRFCAYTKTGRKGMKDATDETLPQGTVVGKNIGAHGGVAGSNGAPSG